MNVVHLHCDFLPLWALRHFTALSLRSSAPTPNRDSPIENNRFFYVCRKVKFKLESTRDNLDIVKERSFKLVRSWIYYQAIYL